MSPFSKNRIVLLLIGCIATIGIILGFFVFSDEKKAYANDKKEVNSNSKNETQGLSNYTGNTYSIMRFIKSLKNKITKAQFLKLYKIYEELQKVNLG